MKGVVMNKATGRQCAWLLVFYLCVGGCLAGDQMFREEEVYMDKLQTMFTQVSTNAISIDDAERILESLEGVKRHASASGQWTSIRKKETVLVCMLMQKINAQRDSRFDPNDVPSASVLPPRAAGFTGPVDPKEIRDDNLRAVYEKAIRANEEKAETYRKQHRLHTRCERFFARAQNYVADIYSRAPPNRSEMEGILSEQQIWGGARSDIIDKVENRVGNKETTGN